MNPILPRQFFIPDAEAHVMSDGRLYLYGSVDKSGATSWCAKEHRVFSTDDPSLCDWIDHGVIIRNTAEDARASWAADTPLYAPDAIEKGGKTYLYICGPGGNEGVSVAEHPWGPFGKAAPVVPADGDGIDPAIFVDEDGAAYFLWGQFALRGGRLTDDMRTIDPRTINRAILTEQEHGFHEGASLRRRGDKYYIVYTDISRGRATALSYAVSDHPLGPYEKGGVIIDNIYCDPETWNNHGSIEEFHGQWYVFYHRSSQNSRMNRRVCAEPIAFDENGRIEEVPMTSQGPSGPICAFSPIDASIACRVKGGAYIAPWPASDSGREQLFSGKGQDNWTGNWAEYRYIDFASGASKLVLRLCGRGTVCLMVEGGQTIGRTAFDAPEFIELPLHIRPIHGVRPVWLLFDGEDIRIDSFRFEP